MLKDISENSQEGLDSSQGRSSSPGHSQGQSHMAASAFAAVSQIYGFQGENQLDEEDQDKDLLHQSPLGNDQDESADQIRLGSGEVAQAERQTAQHEEHQAPSPDNNGAKISKTGANTLQVGANDSQTDSAAGTTGSKALGTQLTPLTESTLKSLRVKTDATESENLSTPTAAPGTEQEPTPASLAPAGSQGSGLAGSTPGSHTYDSELHDGIAALVQAPGMTDKADRQPSGGNIASDLDAATMGIQGLTTASVADSASSQPSAEAAQEGAASADQAPVYSLESDEEDDLAVVSGEDQAREAQVPCRLAFH